MNRQCDIFSDKMPMITGMVHQPYFYLTSFGKSVGK